MGPPLGGAHGVAELAVVYVGSETLLMLKPTTGAYRALNCSAVYADLASDAASGLPCSLLLEGTVPAAPPCDYAKEGCLMAPGRGWCESSAQCMQANEEGGCFGDCPNGQLLYGTTTAPTVTGGAEGGGGGGDQLRRAALVRALRRARRVRLVRGRRLGSGRRRAGDRALGGHVPERQAADVRRRVVRARGGCTTVAPASREPSH